MQTVRALPTLTSIVERKRQMEQMAFEEIRRALSDDFVESPEAFVGHFGKRPEDLTGLELREFYPHFLVQQRPVVSTDETFRKHFLAGNLFGGK